MNRLVYLFELDSVRKTPAEIEAGQSALFEEIVRNGNTVVLTFNQLTDSDAFLAPLHQEDSYEHILSLFESGAITVAQFGSTRTASQFVQSAITRCLNAQGQTFLFSGLKVSSCEKDLLLCLQNALRYSDPSLLDDLIAHNPDQADRLVWYKRYIRLILTISCTEAIAQPERSGSYRHFDDWMELVIRTLSVYEYLIKDLDPSLKPTAGNLRHYLPEALSTLDQIRTVLTENKTIQSRSNWLLTLHKNPDSSARNLAECIIDLCYNFTNENSISGITPHYNPSTETSLPLDIVWRLTSYWKLVQDGNHIFFQQTLPNSSKTPRLPDWQTASRIASFRQKSCQKSSKATPLQDAEYESVYRKDRKVWMRTLAKILIRHFALLVGYIILFVALDQVVGAIQSVLFAGAQTASGSLWSDIGQVFLSTILFGVVSSILANVIHLPDILETFSSLRASILDLWHIVHWTDGFAYNRLSENKESVYV